MTWYVGFRAPRTSGLTEDARLIWAWMQALTPLDPALSLWRPTNRSRTHAHASPPITLDQLTTRIQREQDTSEFPDFVCSPAFVGTIDGQGTTTLFSFGMPNPGDLGITLEGGAQLSAAIDASEELADALMRTSATILNPTIGTLERSDLGHDMYGGVPAPFQYSPGWKMYVATTSPHHERAHQLATRTETLPNGTLMTFGTPTTYPDILNQW